MSFEAESYAFSSSVYGGRPTFALTRRVKDQPEVTLYELAPKDLADARAKRFERAGRPGQVTVTPLSEITVDGDTPAARCRDDSETGPSPSGWSWDEWCGIKITTLRGKQLKAAKSLVRSALGDADRDSSPILSGSSATVCLPEGVGVRLAIGFLGMKPLRRYDKLNQFATGVRRMSLEECYYWHAKARSPSSPNGIKALRVLLADHVN